MNNRFASHVAVFIAGFLVCLIAFRLFVFGGGGATIQSVSCPHPDMKITCSNSVATAADIAGKYVVSIDTVGRPVVSSPDSFLGFQFGQPQEVVPKGKGSGVVISDNGYIITNNHVVSGAASLTVTLYNGKTYNARLIGRDPKTDIAVIKIDALGLPAAQFGNSDNLKVGDWVIAVGNALGLGPTVTAGIISATKRGPIQVENEVLEDALQTDAAINRGNSGGAMADLNGYLVGINTAIASSGPDGGNIGIGFAVPSNTVKKVGTDLIKHGKVVRPWLGIVYAPYNSDIRAQLEKQGFVGLPNAKGGALVQQVYGGSPASDAKLQQGDVILKINDKPLSGTTKVENGLTTVSEEVTHSKVGQTIKLQVWHVRTQQIVNVNVKIGAMPVDLTDEKQPQQRQMPGFPFP